VGETPDSERCQFRRSAFLHLRPLFGGWGRFRKGIGSMTGTELAINRRDLLRKGAAGAVVGAAALAVPGLASAGVSHGSEQIGEIYQLQADFHRAKSHALIDPGAIDLMVSLWADDCTFTFNGTTFTGKDAVRTFFLNSGSWHHNRMSFVPSFKDQIEVHGDTAFLYFECHDVALDTNDPGGAQFAVVTHLTNFGMLRNVSGSWLFWQMHFGSASPLSVDTIYDT
jgi:ketosteroid isomerase-like protein